LSSDSLLANRDAGGLAMALLWPGPPTDTSTNGALNNTNVTNASNGAGASNNPAQVLSESAFHDLMDTVITAALNATPVASRNSGNAFGRGGGNGFRGGTQTPPDDAQNQQNNARGLLMGLQTMVPQIERYLPDRVQAVRKILEDLGLGNNPRLAFNQMNNLMEQGTTDRLLAAAPAAPPRLQSRLYQQAALKAIEGGNTDRALQIANEHLDESMRGVVVQALEFQQLIRTASADKMAEIRQALSRPRGEVALKRNSCVASS